MRRGFEDFFNAIEARNSKSTFILYLSGLVICLVTTLIFWKSIDRRYLFYVILGIVVITVTLQYVAYFTYHFLAQHKNSSLVKVIAFSMKAESKLSHLRYEKSFYLQTKSVVVNTIENISVIKEFIDPVKRFQRKNKG